MKVEGQFCGYETLEENKRVQMLLELNVFHHR
jgi:hypothetical protein